MAELIESQVSQLARATNDIAAVAAVGYLNGAEIHLTKTELALPPDIPLAALVAAEADFTGYAAPTITWDTPGLSADGTVEVLTTPVIFQPTDAVTPNNIYAVFITNAAVSAWYFVGPVDNAPVPLPDALHQCIVTIRYRPATNSLSVTIS